MVKARAVVDTVKESMNGCGLGVYRVEVWGDYPDDYCRVYTISAKDDNSAAFKGLDLFSKEMSHPLRILSAL